MYRAVSLAVPSEAVQERFWAKVDTEGDCWLWKAAVRASDGIGVFGYEGKILYAHRVAYVIAFGSLPRGAAVRRSCTNPLCVRPLHLVLALRGERGPEQPLVLGPDECWLM